MIQLLYLFIGLAVLWLGTNLVIKGASNIARVYKLSETFIGLTIVSIGTNLPETIIAINASVYSLRGNEASGIVLGESIGSCYGQIGMVLGVTGLFGFLSIKREHIYRQGVFVIGSIILVILLSVDGVLNWIDGAVMIVFFLVYYILLFRRERFIQKVIKSIGKKKEIGLNSIKLVGGLTLVAIASNIVVSSALKLTDFWGVEQSLVAIVILGMGSSLPEFAISLTAVLKKHTSMSVGNVIGSNIFDILLPVGIGSIIYPLKVASSLLKFDLVVLLGYSLLLLYFLIRKRGLQKGESAALLVIYLLYIALKVYGV